MKPTDSAPKLGALWPWAGLHVSVLLVTLFPPSQASAQERLGPRQELTPIGGVRISAVYDLDASPPYAYALERENLVVLDVRDPNQVKEVANLEFQGARLRSVIHGTGLYMGGWGTPLAVVDIAEPRQPRWVGEHPEVRHTEGMSIVGDRLYVIQYDGTVTLDVLALTETAGMPRQVATLEVERDTTLLLRGFAHDAGHLFVLLQQTESARSHLVVVAIDELSRPRLERRIALPEGTEYRGVAVRGNVFYMITRDFDSKTGLTVLRLDDSGEAELVGLVTDERLWAGGGMIVNGNAIYAPFKGRVMMATFDVSDPHDPKLAHAFVPEGWRSAGLGSSVADGRLYVSGDMGPSAIFDISYPLEPRFLGRWDYKGGWARDVALHERVAVVLNWGGGILVYDVVDPRSPAPLGVYESWDIGDPQDHLARDGDRVLLSHGPGPSELLDISDPAAPVLVRRFPVPEAVAAAALTSTLAIQAYARGGLGIVDLTNAHRPLARVPLEGAATDLEIFGDLAVVAHRDGGVSVIDIASPESPVVLGRAPGSVDEGREGVVTRLALSSDGTRAFTITGEQESETTAMVAVFDIRPESTVQILGQIEVRLGGFAYDFAILQAGDELLVGVGSDLVRIDVSVPPRLRVRSRHHLKMSFPAEGFAERGQLLFVAAGEAGMQVFELPNR